MWSVWGFLLAIAASIYLYRSRLTRDEEDQIFLGEGFDHEKVAQTEIISRVNKIQPVLMASLWLVGAATLFVIAYYLWDIANQFK
jgi:hypothetical protein